MLISGQIIIIHNVLVDGKVFTRCQSVHYDLINQLYYNRFVVCSITIFVNIKLIIVVIILTTSLT